MVAPCAWTALAALPATIARTASRLLLAWALMAVASVATAAGKVGFTAGHAAPAASTQLAVLAEPGHTDRDDASCLKASPIEQALESGFTKAEAEPELSLDSIRLPRCMLVPCLSLCHREAMCVACRTTPLGRGPPRRS